jgi:carbamoyltransferase
MRSHEIFDGGPIPSPYMLFTHGVKPAWRDRIPVVAHVDGSARIQTIHRESEPAR